MSDDRESTKSPNLSHLDLDYNGSILTQEIHSLIEQIVFDLVRDHWQKIHQLLGACASDNDPSQLSIKIEDGSEIGSAEVVFDNDGAVSIVLICPSEDLGVEKLKQEFLKAGIDYDKEVLRKLFYTAQSQTIFHEGIHVLLESKPGSVLAKAVEALGYSNKNNCHATLLDEGITYACQDIFAPVVEPLGKLEYQLDEGATDIVNLRKKLGRLIRPLIQKYLENNQEIDQAFLSDSAAFMEQVVGKDWSPESSVD